MAYKTSFCCPVHPDQVLFELTTNPLHVLIDGAPSVCPKCAMSYYKWQCIESHNVPHSDFHKSVKRDGST